MARVLILDVDGTIADRDKESLYPAFEQWLSEQNYTHGDTIAFATNQGGVGYGNHLERAGMERGIYPTQTAVTQRLIELATQIKQIAPDVRIIIEVCYYYKDNMSAGEGQAYHPLRRKPNPAMLFSIMEKLNYKFDELLFVGDSDDDILAGLSAGLTHAGKFGFKLPLWECHE